MQFFFNELSLQEQYLNGRDFEDAIVCLLSTAKKIQEIDYPKELLSDKNNLAAFKPISGKYFLESLKAVDAGLSKRLKEFIYDTCDDWRKNQSHSTSDIFAIGVDNVTNTSNAELAERKFNNGVSLCALLNFQDSTLRNQQSIIVIKNGTTTITLECIDGVQALQEWTSSHEIEITGSANAYDYSSTFPPSDNQTILRQSGRFARTHKVEQGRTVYREKRTGYFWFVDNLHRGSESHIEVFDQRGDHVGDSDLEGNINYGNKNATKRINI